MFKSILFFIFILFVLNPCWAEPDFKLLKQNEAWYRTFDTASTIVGIAGERSLLFAWLYGDEAEDRQPDSFYVGIDTLWALPQNVEGVEDVEDNDWDLQVCPETFCIQGLERAAECQCGEADASKKCPEGYCVGGQKKSGFGGYTAIHFGGLDWEVEHHFQFYNALKRWDDGRFRPTAPNYSIFGGYMYVESRSTGIADTVFAFGSWELEWDTTALPPLHPEEGYLPKMSDFVIADGKVSYQKGANFVLSPKSTPRQSVNYAPMVKGSKLYFTEGQQPDFIKVYNLDGSQVMQDLSPQIDHVYEITGLNPGTYIYRAKVLNGIFMGKVAVVQ